MQHSPSRGSLLVVFLTVFIDLLGFGMVIPLLPIYAEQFTVDRSGVLIGVLMACFSAMQFLCAPLWGRLSDRIGRRPVILVGLAGSVVFYSLFGVATVLGNLVLLFVARIGAGISGATIPTAQAYIADTTTLETRAKGMALIGAAFGLGFTFGPLFGYLAVPTGTGDPGPGPGYAAAVLSLCALLLAWFKLPESLRPDSEHSDRRLLDVRALWSALTMPTIGPILLSLTICIFAFANLETTLSMMIKGESIKSPFHFTFQQVCLTYAYIGFTLSMAQGLLVRRISGKVPELGMAAAGTLLEIAGFGGMIFVVTSPDLTPLFDATISLPLVGPVALGFTRSTAWLLGSLTLLTVGYSLLMPSLHSLVSRRSDPARQGAILGLAQSLGSLARILGPMVALPMLHVRTTLPYGAGAGLMGFGLLVILFSVGKGKDFASSHRPGA
jgi:MFS family permease